MFRKGKEENDTGETSLFALLYTQFACPQQHYASKYVRISIVRSKMYHVWKKKRDLSLVKKKTKTKPGCSETTSLALRWRLQDSEWYSPTGKEDLTLEDLKGRKEKSPLCENATFTALTVLSLDVWHSSSFQSRLLLSMMFSSQQSES